MRSRSIKGLRAAGTCAREWRSAVAAASPAGYNSALSRLKGRSEEYLQVAAKKPEKKAAKPAKKAAPAAASAAPAEAAPATPEATKQPAEARPADKEKAKVAA